MASLTVSQVSVNLDKICLGDRVELVFELEKSSGLTGRVSGFGYNFETPSASPVKLFESKRQFIVLVTLDKQSAFWSEDRKTWVSCLVCDPSCLSKIGGDNNDC